MYNFDFSVISKNENCNVSLKKSIEDDILFVGVKMEQSEKVVPF